MKIRFITFTLSCILLLGLLCSCNQIGVQGPQGEMGPQGPQGEVGPAGNDGAAFLTGKGEPSSELGKIGDSYLDVSGEEWGFYVKNEDGWELLGFIETEPVPLTLSDLNGSYELSYVISKSGAYYYIGDTFAGVTLSPDMIRAELQEGKGQLSVNFGFPIITNMTCTIEYDKLIMICEDTINITGQPSSVYEMSIVRDGEIYVVLESYGEYYYVKKVS